MRDDWSRDSAPRFVLCYGLLMCRVVFDCYALFCYILYYTFSYFTKSSHVISWGTWPRPVINNLRDEEFTSLM